MDIFGSDKDDNKDPEREFVDAPTLYIGGDFFNRKEGKKYFEALKKSTIATKLCFATENFDPKFDGWDLALDALRHNQNIIECSFSLSYLSGGGLKAVAELLSFSKIKKFHLEITPQFMIDEDEALLKVLYKQVASAIKDNHYIEDITIGSAMERFAFEEDMTLFFDSVKAHPTIKQLNVLSYAMDGENMKMIADVVNNSNITVLSLTGNTTNEIDGHLVDYTVEVVEHLIELTRVNKNLTCLRLAEGFAEKFAGHLFEGLVLSNNRSLEELHLYQGSLVGCEKYLGQFFSANLPVKTFGMRAVAISKERLSDIMAGLAQNTHIEIMDLCNNNLAAEVLRVLKNHRSITDIDLRGNSLSDNTVDLVTDVLKNNKILRALHFQTNDPLNTIWDSLKHNQSLTALTIKCIIGIVDLTALEEMTKVNQSLNKLTLENAGHGDPNSKIYNRILNAILNVIQPFTERNKLEQRLNVTNTSQTIATISKSKSFFERLPKEIWRNIISYISYPGVVMDFSSKI